MTPESGSVSGHNLDPAVEWVISKATAALAWTISGVVWIGAVALLVAVLPIALVGRLAMWAWQSKGG